MTPNKDAQRQLIHHVHDWNERLNSDHATPADLVAFEAWLEEDDAHVEAWERSQTLIASYDYLRGEDLDADVLQMPPAAQRKSALSRVFVSLIPIRPAAIAAALCAFAAICALPVLLRLSSPNQIVSVDPTRYQTGIGETDVIDLPDGSQLALGPATALSVNFTHERRAVTLRSGAAIFDVAKDADRPFSVTAGELVATALGTRFEVRSNGGVERVGVAEGTVRVRYDYPIADTGVELTDKRVLQAGDQVATTQGSGLRATTGMALAGFGDWQTSKRVYDGATIAEVVADANRYFERQVELGGSMDDLARETLTATFDMTDQAAIFETLAYAFPISIDKSEEGIITISSKSAVSGSPANK